MPAGRRMHSITSSNLAASFGQTKIRLEVRSASPEQYAGDFNTEKEWHQHMPTPWDVMQLNPAEALTISCQSCASQGWPRSSKSLALSPHIPHNINSVPSANTAQPGNGKHNWPQLALIPLPLHLKASDPGKRRRTRHSRLFENEAEAWARGAKCVCTEADCG